LFIAQPLTASQKISRQILHSWLPAHGAQAVFSFIVLCAPRAGTRYENPAPKNLKKIFVLLCNLFVLISLKETSYSFFI